MQDEDAELALLAHENLAMRLGRRASVGNLRALQKGPSVVGTRSLRRRASSASIGSIGGQQQLDAGDVVGGGKELLMLPEGMSMPKQQERHSAPPVGEVALRRLVSSTPLSPRAAAAPAALAVTEVQEASPAAGTAGGEVQPLLGRDTSGAGREAICRCLTDLTRQTSSMVSQLKVSPTRGGLAYRSSGLREPMSGLSAGARESRCPCCIFLFQYPLVLRYARSFPQSVSGS